jgi:hypothetical protein
MFGGEDANGNMCDRLKILKIYSICDLEKKGVKNFEEIKTRGEGPCSRTNHSMNLISKKKLPCHHRWSGLKYKPTFGCLDNLTLPLELATNINLPKH